MDIFNKMNPFTRPSSRQTWTKERQSIDSYARPSSSLESNLPSLPESDGEVNSLELQRRYLTPGPHTPKRHARTPSLLRSLAHHPSLSALRSKKSEKKKKAKKGTFTELVDEGGYEDWRGLKGSKSVPRNLRGEEENIPPVPTLSPTIDFSQRQRQRGLAHPAANIDNHPSISSRRPTLDRANSATPSIVVQHHDMGTPESVKIRRMKFEIEIESPSSRQRRARSASTSVGDSPSKLSSGRTSRRHLSSPAPPRRRNSSSPSLLTSLAAPLAVPIQTTQHPHPVPLDLTRSPSPGSISSYYLGHHDHRDDFIPLSDSGRWLEEGHDHVLDDGLDLLVPEEEYPVGTPGGKKADLKLGAFVDGAKREKNAIRFFSRDMYSHPHSSTPLAMQPSGSRQTPSSTFSTSTSEDQPERKRPTLHSRRSSSPFEVKLSATVSKRVSLDAFGGSAPIASSDPAAEEELLEDIASESEEEDGDESEEDDRVQVAIDFGQAASQYSQTTLDLATFHGTTLSTIDEVSSRHIADITTEHCLPQPQDTRYFTPPASPRKLHQQLSQSPFLPPRKHLSAPPLRDAVVKAHEAHTKALRDQLEASGRVITELQAEARKLRDAVEEEADEKRKAFLDVGSVQRELVELEAQCLEKDTVVDQLRAAIHDNEKWFDDLHHNYEEALQRVADLEHDIVGAEGDRGLVENELRRCQHAMDEMMEERDQAQAAIHELQTSLSEVEAQLSATVDDYTILLGSHGAELAEARQLLFERDSSALMQAEELRLESDKVVKLEGELKATVDDFTAQLGNYTAELAEARQSLFERDSNAITQAEQLRLETDKVAKLEGELKTSHLILASQEGEISTLKDKIGQARFGANEKMFQARAEIDGLKREIEAKDIEVEEMAEEMRGMRNEQDQGDRERGELLQVIHRLRSDEASSANLQDTIHDLESQLSTMSYRVRELEGELEDRSTLLDSRSLLSTSQGGEIARLRGQLASAEEALYEAQLDLKRQAKSVVKLTEQLEAQSSEIQQDVLRAAYEEAILQVEVERTKADHAKSRLNAYNNEMDRVTLSETRLREEVAGLRHQSASDEMAKVELERKVKRLEDDKELLNVALESKQTELALVLSSHKSVRPPSTPCTTSSRTLYSSTSRSVQSHADITPRPLASSVASVTSKASRRESSIISQSPTKVSPGKKLAPLGSSTRHNRTPEKQKASSMATKIVISTSKPKARASVQLPSDQPVVTRRSSLPVLKRPVSVVGDRKRVSDYLKEEDEDAFA